MNINDIFELDKYNEAYEFVSENKGTTIEYLEGGKYKIVELPKTTIEELSEIKRIERNSLLGKTDAKMLPDFPISAEEKELWLLYRQYLRDITKDPAFPNVDVLNFANWLGQIHSKEPVLGA